MPGEVSGQARITCHQNVLLVLGRNADDDIRALARDFSGTVVTLADFENLDVDEMGTSTFVDKVVYVCGDLSGTPIIRQHLNAARCICVIRELCWGEGDPHWTNVNVGRVPILVHDMGVYYRRFFNDNNFFDRIQTEHAFQRLTESTKPGTALRSGIYLTSVEQRDRPSNQLTTDNSSKDSSSPAAVEQQGNGDLYFRLLRCSSNFSGPTENFSQTDREILDSLNTEAENIFEKQAPLNHVLAQIYHNTPATEATKKETKAKIKAHSDKTKDMPSNALMAFVTFYDHSELKDRLNPVSGATNFDWTYQGISGLTKLHFQLKSCVLKRLGEDCTLARSFTVVLFPNSVFFMPLSTNRLYTHEICPSQLNANRIPTRLGYVVRCSDQEAIWRPGMGTLIKKRSPGAITGSEHWKKLESPSPGGMSLLRERYAEENFTDAVVEYGDIPFSMNSGDYLQPRIDLNEAKPIGSIPNGFRCLHVPLQHENMFEDLLASVACWEDVGKGRQGAVLLRPHVDNESRMKFPIVRTTTKYTHPAQCFRTIHEDLAKTICRVVGLTSSSEQDDSPFNNALIENYTADYAKMGFHSDQALDLASPSTIAVFSCYKYPEGPSLQPQRLLVIEEKEESCPDEGMSGSGSGKQPMLKRYEIPLGHNTVVVWSTDTNRQYRHKIVRAGKPDDNVWLGVTFRTSKTLVHTCDGALCFDDGTPLTVADKAQRNEFCKLRGRENMEIDFEYPALTYTISASDLLQPTD